MGIKLSDTASQITERFLKSLYHLTMSLVYQEVKLPILFEYRFLYLSFIGKSPETLYAGKICLNYEIL